MDSIGIVCLRQWMKRKMGKVARIAVIQMTRQWQVVIRIIATEMQFRIQIKMLFLWMVKVF